VRVAMVSEHASPLAVLGGVDAGGQNVHVASLSKELGRRGAELTVFTRRDDAALPERAEFAPGVTVVHVDAGPARPIPKDGLLPYMDEFACALARAWAVAPPDLVHAHFWMSAQASLEAARPLGIPVVQTFHALGVVKRRHQGAFDTSPPGRIAAEEVIARRVDGIVATSSEEVFELLRMGADLRRVRVVPCGVDLSVFTPDGPAEPRSRRGRRLLVVSRLVQRKGVGNVISALAGLPETELVVAGGPERSELARDAEARRLAALAAERGVYDRVDFRGRVDRADLPILFRSADAVVCVPWYEPFGIVPLEAMACGVPVVASAVGGHLDTVVDGITGIHVPPRSPERLSEALRTLLAEPELRARMGSAGAERARSRYSWETVADATLETYATVLRSRAAPGAVTAGGGSLELDEADVSAGRTHLQATVRALESLATEVDRISGWGRRLARVLSGGGRLLVGGNGGSAAQAQHLTGELVGRYCDERAPFSAIPLHTDSASLTAIANDYGAAESLARQVRAHGRPGDVLLVLTTSGRSPNIVAAAEAAIEGGLTVWALTGPGPNPVTDLADDAISVDAAATAVVQEAHLSAIHLLCAAVDAEVRVSAASAERLDEVLKRGLP
jgi:glycosyltransferase involved in cell wall biosynthesis/phosphoheptose isomerase